MLKTGQSSLYACCLCSMECQPAPQMLRPLSQASWVQGNEDVICCAILAVDFDTCLAHQSPANNDKLASSQAWKT